MPFQNTNLPFFYFPSLSQFPFLRHAVFTRLGGYSRRTYASLNLSYDVGDDPVTVNKNLNLVKQFFSAEKLIWSRQIHDKNVLVIQDEAKPPYEGFDAFVTNRPGLALLVKLADCQGILLCDPIKKVIAAIHCGWRGNVANIIAATVDVMEKEFHTKPTDIWAGISPSLGPCCAEFKDYQTLLPKAFWRYRINGNYFDWWRISRDQLMAKGIPAKQIEIAGICTVCDTRFFSYRRDGKSTGRFGAVIMLKGEESCF
ncbi:MAG: peptidoglycan editing factor PgeF [Candidatus Desulfofervidaceae bacterium]|nr:peptidoglycan editing factor PgeF [Candidatus Desulfofervidaceae bacterium]